MFGYLSYLDKSMNGIKTISDGVAFIQNGNATFNTINVETITSSNLTDCNLSNCTTNDPTTPQSVANKEYVDDNFVNRTNNLNQDINGIKTFLSVPICATNASTNSQLTNKGFTDTTYVDRTNNLTQIINGTKSFSATMYVAGIGAYPTNTSKDIFTNMVAGQGGSLTLGATGIALAINATATFNNNTPICSVATPTASNHLCRKDYIDNNFVYKTGAVAEGISGAKTFNNSCTAGINFTVNSGLFCNTLNARNPSVNTPRELWTNLTTASTITMGTNNTPITINSTTLSVSGATTFSQDITAPNIFCNDALYLNDYQSLPTPTTYSSILVQNTDILNFDANFNNNKFQFKVSSNAVLLLDATNTTIYNDLNSLSQATFSGDVTLRTTKISNKV